MTVWVVKYQGSSYLYDNNIVFADKQSAIAKAKEWLNKEDCNEVKIVNEPNFFYLEGSWCHQLGVVRVYISECNVLYNV